MPSGLVRSQGEEVQVAAGRALPAREAHHGLVGARARDDRAHLLLVVEEGAQAHAQGARDPDERAQGGDERAGLDLPHELAVQVGPLGELLHAHAPRLADRANLLSQRVPVRHAPPPIMGATRRPMP